MINFNEYIIEKLHLDKFDKKDKSNPSSINFKDGDDLYIFRIHIMDKFKSIEVYLYPKFTFKSINKYNDRIRYITDKDKEVEQTMSLNKLGFYESSFHNGKIKAIYLTKDYWKKVNEEIENKTITKEIISEYTNGMENIDDSYDIIIGDKSIKV